MKINENARWAVGLTVYLGYILFCDGVRSDRSIGKVINSRPLSFQLCNGKFQYSFSIHNILPEAIIALNRAALSYKGGAVLLLLEILDRTVLGLSYSAKAFAVLR